MELGQQSQKKLIDDLSLEEEKQYNIMLESETTAEFNFAKKRILEIRKELSSLGVVFLDGDLDSIIPPIE